MVGNYWLTKVVICQKIQEKSQKFLQIRNIHKISHILSIISIFFIHFAKSSNLPPSIQSHIQYGTINHHKFLENKKKLTTPLKSSKSQLSIDIRFSTQTQEMTEIWSNEKKVYRGGNIFFCWVYFFKNFIKKYPFNVKKIFWYSYFRKSYTIVNFRL